MLTKLNTTEKKWFNYKRQKRNLTAKIETHSRLLVRVCRRRKKTER